MFSFLFTTCRHLSASLKYPSRAALFNTAVTIATCMAAPPAWSQEDVDTERSARKAMHSQQGTRLAPIVVTATAPHSPLTVVTDPRQPQQPAPATDGADYLSTIPGFSMIRNGGTNGDPVFRGMFGSRLKVLTNGAEMLGACPSRMDAPTSYITPESFDRITVVKGPQSVLWGPAASAGTVHFDRGPEHFDQPDIRVDGSLLAGTHGRFDRRLEAAAGNRQGYIRLQGSRSEANDYKDGAGRTVPSEWDKWSGDVALGVTPDDDTWLEISGGRGNGDARYAGRGMDGARFLRETAALRFEKSDMSEQWRKLEMQANYAYADHVMDNFSLRNPTAMPMHGHMASTMHHPMGGQGMSANKMAMELDRRTRSARLASTWEWHDLHWVSGVDANHQEHRGRNSSHDMMGHYRNPDDSPWNKDYHYTQYGLFNQLTWHASDRSRLISGIRIDHYHIADDTRANASSGEARNSLRPSAFIRYEQDLTAQPVSWYAGIGHVQRFPDYWETRPGRAGSHGSRSAFSETAVEKTTQVDVGAQYEGERTKAWISGYAGYINDFILFDYRSHANTRVTNVDATIAGAELGVSHELAPHWKTDATLAYAWGRNASNHMPLPQVPPLETRLGLIYEHEHYSIGGLWRQVFAQHRTARGMGNVTGQDLGKSAAFSVFSANAAYQVNRHITLSSGVDNLLNRSYTEHLNLAGNAAFGFPAHTAFRNPGRMYWARLDFKF